MEGEDSDEDIFIIIDFNLIESRLSMVVVNNNVGVGLMDWS